jgi:trans-2,3-dihydro-3-hydroxyanthranilate isomerase
MTHYIVYDVFTDTTFGGNQLAVFPDASTLPQDKLQHIAAEFNFSEVTFVYPPEDASNTAKVRIFTPTSEIDFAGHPVIGTVIALSDLGYSAPMVLELGVGPLNCTVENGVAAFTTTAPLELFGQPPAPLVARALGLPETAIKTVAHPPQQASLGLPFVFVELQTREDLASCLTDVSAFREGLAAYPTSLDFAIFAYVKDGNHISSRMFAPLDNIPEDPATGSASATLAALLTQIRGTPQSLEFHQGEDMGRSSFISANTTIDPITVTISGTAVKVMEGSLTL